MSEFNDSVEFNEAEIVADPKRPYKAYATLVAAFLSSILASELPLNIWARAFIAAVLAALAVYIVPNPLAYKITEKGHPVGTKDDPQLW